MTSFYEARYIGNTLRSQPIAGKVPGSSEYFVAECARGAVGSFWKILANTRKQFNNGFVTT